MTVSTHVLDTERGRPAAGVHVELYGPDGSLAGAGVTDDDGRIARLAEAGRGHLPDRLPPTVAVLQARRARDRARRRPLPRATPDLVVRMRELPRQLTAEQLAELFEGRTRFVERLAALEDPLGQARDGGARAVRRRAEGAPRRAPGDRRQGDLRPLRRRAGQRRRPERARRARRAERGVRGEVRLPLRRLRQPPAAARDRARSSASACSAAATRSWRRPSTSSSRSRSTGGSRPSALRHLVGLGEHPLPLAARDRRDGVDRRVVLLHRARQPPRAAEGSGGRAARHRRGGVGDPRRRLLSRREVPGRARPAARAAALVQVGGVHDVALRLRALRRRLLRPRDVVPDRSDRRRPRGVAGDRDLDRRARARVARLRRALPHVRERRGAARRARLRVHLRVGVGVVRALRRRGRRTCRSAR